MSVGVQDAHVALADDVGEGGPSGVLKGGVPEVVVGIKVAEKKAVTGGKEGVMSGEKPLSQLLAGGI